jgi:hypothetical protein
MPWKKVICKELVMGFPDAVDDMYTVKQATENASGAIYAMDNACYSTNPL